MTQRYALLEAVLNQDGALAFHRRFIKAKLEAPHATLEEILSVLAPSSAAGKGQKSADRLSAAHISFTTLLDADYPLMLKHIADPPPVLFYSGELQNLHRPCISIVGSRSTTTYGRQTAKKLAAELARLGFVVVSGLALGVDAAAHQATLEVSGRTVAVLGTGVDSIYPREHRPLAVDIVRNQGTVISEFIPGVTPRPFHFPVRNRIISGLAHATIVVEAKEKSGSLITARHCLDQGRELFAVPGPIHHETSAGPNGLIDRGEARALLSVSSVLEQLQPLLGLAANHEQRVKQKIEDPLAQKIYEKLDAFQPLPLDLLVTELGEDTGTVISRLVQLESLNLVESRPGQQYVRNPVV